MVSPRFSESQYFASRWKSGLSALGCVAFVLMGWWLTEQIGTSRYSAPVQHAVGWLTIIGFGALFPFWLASTVTPDRLWIGKDCFRVKLALRREKRYLWKDIDRVWVSKSLGSSWVVWNYKPGVKKKHVLTFGFGYDAALPGHFQVPATKLETELNAAKGFCSAENR